MDGTIQLRPMERALRDEVLALELHPQQHPYVPAIDRVLARAELKADVREFVILRRGLVVGYFQLNLSMGETAHYCPGIGICGLEAMMVDRHVQGQGIGTAALAQLPALVRRLLPGYHQVNLTVNFTNVAAQKLYRRSGFVDTGDVFEGAASGPQHVYALILEHEARAHHG